MFDHWIKERGQETPSLLPPFVLPTKKTIMENKTFTHTECFDLKEGAIVYRDGERILRTTLATDDPKRHNTLAKIVADLLNQWQEDKKGGTVTARTPSPKSDVDIKRVNAIVEAAIDNKDKLNDFETGFIEDMVDRLLKYGDGTFVSGPQMGVLERLAEKLEI